MIQSCPMITNHKYASIVSRLIKIQFFIGFVVTVGFAVYKHSANTACSGIAGVLLAMVPTVVYAKIAFVKKLASTPSDAFMRHKKAMLVRFVINFVFFAIVLFLYKKCDYITLFIVYFVTLAGYWVSLVKS